MMTFVTLIGMCLATSPAAEKKPNIVLVMADDQGWGDMAYNGHQRLKTPHFDQMAAEGLRFDRFYAAAPVCSPTRASVLTGRNPNRCGVVAYGHPLRPQEITIAEALKTAGYATGHFGKWHLGSVRPGSPVNPGANGFDRWLSAENYYDIDAVLSRQGVAVQIDGEGSMVAVDAAIEFIQQCVSSEKPFLAVVWFGSPHSPHRVLEEDRQPYADLPDREQRFLGEITAMDRAFGKLRAAIREQGLRDDTILWYTSDNGALPRVGSTGGHRGGKGALYEGGLLVPAILEWPPLITKPRVTNVRCNTSDIYPTLLDIVGVESENQPPLDGISLKPLIEGEMEQRVRPMGFWSNNRVRGMGAKNDELMAELLAAQQAGTEPDDPTRLRLDAGEIKKVYSEDQFPGHSAWIDDGWKLHRFGQWNGSPKFALYHLSEDRQESNDLVDEQPERVEKMKTALEAWLLSAVRSLNGANY